MSNEIENEIQESLVKDKIKNFNCKYNMYNIITIFSNLRRIQNKKKRKNITEILECVIVFRCK